MCRVLDTFLDKPKRLPSPAAGFFSIHRFQFPLPPSQTEPVVYTYLSLCSIAPTVHFHLLASHTPAEENKRLQNPTPFFDHFFALLARASSRLHPFSIPSPSTTLPMSVFPHDAASADGVVITLRSNDLSTFRGRNVVQKKGEQGKKGKNGIRG